MSANIGSFTNKCRRNTVSWSLYLLEYSLGRLMLKLKLQYFGHLMQRNDSLEKTLMMGKIEGGWRRGRQRMRWLNGITDMMMSVVDGQGRLACYSPWGHKESDMIEWLNWTELTDHYIWKWGLEYCVSYKAALNIQPDNAYNAVTRPSTWNSIFNNVKHSST